MIVHVIGRRKSFGRVLAYLAGPGRNGEHVAPRVVAGDREAAAFVDEPMDSTAARLTAEHLDSARVTFQSRVKEPALHVAISFSEDTTAEQRQAVYQAYVERMGCFDRSAWVAVEHGRSAVRQERGQTKGGHEHGHLVISCVGDDGRAVRLGKHKDRSQDVARGIERDHGLVVLESREMGVGGRGYHPAEVAIAERLHGKGTEPARNYLERVVRAAGVEATGEPDFLRRVRERGVRVQVARYEPGSTERVAAYKYSVKDSAEYSGGRLARDLTLPRLRERWKSPEPQTADQAAHRAAGRLASASLRSERGMPGPLARESRELSRFAQTRASATTLVLPTLAAQLLKERVRAAEQRAAAVEQERDAVASRRGVSREHDRGIGI